MIDTKILIVSILISVQLYQDLACCAAVKANGANVEHALHLLYLAKGNIQVKLQYYTLG